MPLASARWTPGDGFGGAPRLAVVADELGRGRRLRPAALQQPPVARELGELLEERLARTGRCVGDADGSVAAAGRYLRMRGPRRDRHHVARLSTCVRPSISTFIVPGELLEALRLVRVHVRLGEKAARAPDHLELAHLPAGLGPGPREPDAEARSGISSTSPDFAMLSFSPWAFGAALWRESTRLQSLCEGRPKRITTTTREDRTDAEA